MLPIEIVNLMKKIEEKGFQVYIVGGYVRDHLLNIQNHDYDLCTNCDLNELKRLFPELVIMKENNHRNTGVLRINDKEIEISSFKGNHLEEDIKKRDFTINSLAMNSDGKIYDYSSGIEDIKSKTINLCDKSGKGLVDDPLRILRAIRFSSIYGFKISPETKKQMINNKHLLKNVAVERILRELSLILTSDKPSIYLREYRDIFAEIIPYLENTFDFKQNNPYHVYDVFEHTLSVIDNTENNLVLRYAALFHDIGKPECYTVDENGKGHFYNHPVVSSQIFNLFAKQYKMDNKTRDRINRLVLYHDNELSIKDTKIKNYLIMVGLDNIDLMFKLKRADILAQNPLYNARLEDLNYKANIYHVVIDSNPCLSLKDLNINGNDLIEMGYNGSEIGAELNKLLSMVIKNQISNDREQLLDCAYQNYRDKETIEL